MKLRNNSCPMVVGDLISRDIADRCRDQLGLPGPLTFVTVSLDQLRLDQTSAASFLVAPEMERFHSFRYAKRQRQWLGGRLAAKTAAAGFYNPTDRPLAITWHDWHITPDEHGRPFILYTGPGSQVKLPHISISHSGELAAAMASSCPCGLDIQQISATVVRVRERFVGKKEGELVRDSLPTKLDEPHRLSLLWAAKEAVRKTIAVSPLLGFMEIQLVEIKAGQAGFFLLEFDLLPGTTRTFHTSGEGRPGLAVMPARLAVMAFFYRDFAAAFAGVRPTTNEGP